MAENTGNAGAQPEAPLDIGAVVTPDGVLDMNSLQAVVSRHWKKTIVIKCADVRSASKIGTNFTSAAWRVAFTYHKAGEADTMHMDSVVVKTRPSSTKTTELMNTATAFANEIYSYESVLPDLSEQLGIPLRVPQFFHGNEQSIVLEDMCRKNFLPINKKLASEWKQIWSPIQEMAKLHAASIVMKETMPNKFEALVNSIVKIPIEKTLPLGEKQNSSLDTVLKVLAESPKPDKNQKLIDFLKKMRDETWKRQKALIEDDVPIRVINHGSIWVNSLLYREDMVTLLDWQHIVYSSAALDLSFFLYVNLDCKFLASNRRNLYLYYLLNLQRYVYDSLVNRITGDRLREVFETLSMEWITAEMKKFCIFGFMMAQWITPFFYWSEAVFQIFKDRGGLENMTVEERMRHLTFDQKSRMIQLAEMVYREFHCIDYVP